MKRIFATMGFLGLLIAISATWTFAKTKGNPVSKTAMPSVVIAANETSLLSVQGPLADNDKSICPSGSGLKLQIRKSGGTHTAALCDSYIQSAPDRKVIPISNSRVVMMGTANRDYKEILVYDLDKEQPVISMVSLGEPVISPNRRYVAFQQFIPRMGWPLEKQSAVYLLYDLLSSPSVNKTVGAAEHVVAMYPLENYRSNYHYSLVKDPNKIHNRVSEFKWLSNNVVSFFDFKSDYNVKTGKHGQQEQLYFVNVAIAGGLTKLKINAKPMSEKEACQTSQSYRSEHSGTCAKL